MGFGGMVPGIGTGSKQTRGAEWTTRGAYLTHNSSSISSSPPAHTYQLSALSLPSSSSTSELAHVEQNIDLFRTSRYRTG